MKHLLAIGLAWLCGCLHAYAAPQINWGDQLRIAQQSGLQRGVSMDVIKMWESTRVGDVRLSNAEFFEPELVWQWPSARFEFASNSPNYLLKQGERLVARFTVFSEENGTDLNLNVGMPRMDAVHLSYRYDGGAWKTMSAGDTLAMNTWPVPQQQPAFDIPLMRGRMDVIVQVAHRGNVRAPFLLQNDREYISDITTSSSTMGLLVGFSPNIPQQEVGSLAVRRVVIGNRCQFQLRTANAKLYTRI